MAGREGRERRTLRSKNNVIPIYVATLLLAAKGHRLAIRKLRDFAEYFAERFGDWF